MKNKVTKSEKIVTKLLICIIIILSNTTSFAQNWDEVIKITNSDREIGDLFGGAVAISGNYAIVGAYTEDEDATGMNTLNNSGSAYLFERDANGNWVEMQKIVASDRGDGDRFGSAVAISGDYAIVGAFFEDEDLTGGNTLTYSGSCYIFEKDGSGSWSEVQKIVAPVRAADDRFGYSVSISGNQILVGAYFEDDDAAEVNTSYRAGSAYIYERDGTGVWGFAQKIVASDREANDEFGKSVAIYDNYIIVGAYHEDDDVAGNNSLNHSGSAYIYEKNGAGVWNEVQKIVAADRGEDDGFGVSVAISNNYVIIGALYEDEDTLNGNTFSNAGSAYVFERDGSGSWNEAQKIVASDRASDDEFGYSVSISEDFAIVGANYEDEDTLNGNTLSDAGSAYIYKRDGSGNWNEYQKIVASERAVEDYFGFSVAISGDYIIVGAYLEDEDATGGNTLNLAGAAYIHELPNSVGILENEFGSKFILYPNPTNGQFSIDLGNYYEQVTVTITDINGKIIELSTFNKSQFLNLKIEESAGIYMLLIESNSKVDMKQRKKTIIKLLKE